MAADPKRSGKLIHRRVAGAYTETPRRVALISSTFLQPNYFIPDIDIMDKIGYLEQYDYEGSQLQRDVHSSSNNKQTLLNLLKQSKLAVESHKEGIKFFEAAVQDIEHKILKAK